MLNNRSLNKETPIKLLLLFTRAPMMESPLPAQSGTPINIPNPEFMGSNDTGFASLLDVRKAEVRLPWNLKTGLSRTFSRRIRIPGMLNFAGWSRINPSYNNSMMIHIGIRWNANEKTSISAGYFSQLERDDQFYIASLNQDFLSAGITFSVMRNLRLSATVLDSHILSGDQVDSIYGEQGQRFNQTQLMAGTSVLLN